MGSTFGGSGGGLGGGLAWSTCCTAIDSVSFGPSVTSARIPHATAMKTPPTTNFVFELARWGRSVPSMPPYVSCPRPSRGIGCVMLPGAGVGPVKVPMGAPGGIPGCVIPPVMCIDGGYGVGAPG